MVTGDMEALSIERRAWLGYLQAHDRLLRDKLASVPWNCEVRATLSRLLELNVQAYMEDAQHGQG